MIYKYLDGKTLEPVTNRTLKFATLDDLNDPFENLPVIETRFMTPEDVPSVLEGMGLLVGYTGTLDPKSLEDLAKTFNENASKLIDQTEHRFSSILNQISVRKQVESAIAFGVLSLSTDPKSSLMWSHYCNKHQGYVLGFDKEHSFFRRDEDKPPSLGRLISVRYSKRRVKIGAKARQAAFFESIRRKSIDWAYEQEVRMVMPLSACKENKPSIYTLEYPHDALKQVIFGINCCSKIVDRIKGCLPESQVEYLRAVPSSVSFDMELMPEKEFFSNYDSYLKAGKDKLKPTIDRLRNELSQP